MNWLIVLALKSILSSIIGSSFYQWFQGTTLGIWFQKQVDRFMEYFAEKYVGNSDAILDISRCYESNPFMPNEMRPLVESYSIYAARMERDADDRPVLRRLVNEIAPDAEERTVL